MVNKKNNALTFVQIICSLLIVNYHTNILEIPKLEIIAKGGFLMNTVFVFLSGYLLTRSYAKKESEAFGSFLVKRAQRIYPSFHFTLLFILGCSLFLNASLSIPSFFYWMTGFGYYNPANEIFASTHLWFVSVILTCYLLFFITYRLVKAGSFIYPLILGATLGILLLTTVDTSKTYSVISNNILFRFLYHYFVFTFAMYWQVSSKRIESVSIFKVAAFIFATAAYFYFVGHDALSGISILAAILFSFLFVSIIYNLNPFVENRFPALYRMGTITYELYLIHFPVILVIDHYMHGQVIGYFLSFAISIPMAFLLNKLSVYYLKLFSRRVAVEESRTSNLQ